MKMTRIGQEQRLWICMSLAWMACIPGAVTNADEASVPAPKRVPVVFSGGHETDPRDHGRPVVLVAGALGVAPDVFREAFSHVRPAPAGSEPDPEQVRRNKEALLSTLGRYGVKNDRLDDVSNYYRYRPGSGASWPKKAASAYAIVEEGRVMGFVIDQGGNGYSSQPVVTIPGLPGVVAKVELSFDKDFSKNGSIRRIHIAATK